MKGLIEDVVREALIGTSAFQALTKYANQPAVFYGSVPNDKDSNWGERQFPHSAYMIDWSYSADRAKAGNLLIDIVCVDSMDIAPENIAAVLASEMSELFVTEGNETYCIVWKRSDKFESVQTQKPRTMGVTVSFDMVAFPAEHTESPDAVWSMMRWIKEQKPGTKVIGIDALDRIWRPTEEAPACYVRMDGMATPVKPTYACVWLSANLVIHVICTGQRRQQAWIKALVDALSMEGEVVMDDGSPFFVHRLSVTQAANPIINGQIVVNGEYGVLRKPEPAEPLRHAHFGKEG